MRYSKLLLCLWLILGTQLLNAQPSDLLKAYQNAGKLKITPARQQLAAYKIQNKKIDGWAIYIEDFTDMVTLLVSDNHQLFDKWVENEDKRLEQLEKLPANDPHTRFFQAEVRLHWAFAKLKFGKEVSACWDIIKSYKLLEENVKLYPNFLPQYKPLGLLHILIGSTPQGLNWMTNILGLKGNIQLGLDELKKVYSKEGMFQTEAALTNILVHSYILTYTEALNTQFLNLIAQEPDNLLLYFFCTTTSIKDNRCEQALRIINTRPASDDYFVFPFFDFLKADILTKKEKYAEALTYLDVFVSKYQGQNFLKDTYFKYFLCHWLNNDENKAKTYINKILTVGKATVEADKVALQFAENYQKKGLNAVQKSLMKARLAFDGGYNDRSLQILQLMNEKEMQNIEKAEYNYRLGRIAQRKEEPNKAIVYHEKAYQISKVLSYSSGALAALQLGYIYLAKNNKTKAIEYFKIAHQYPKHEYKNSIDNKAKAALTSLGE